MRFLDTVAAGKLATRVLKRGRSVLLGAVIPVERGGPPRSNAAGGGGHVRRSGAKSPGHRPAISTL